MPTHDWKFRNGTHFYCTLNVLGYIENVLGVVSPTDNGFVGCAQNKFDTYHEFEELAQAKVHVEGLVALEGDEHGNE